MMNKENLKELRIQQGIKAKEDEIVQLIQEALDKSDQITRNLEESQFRNLVRVATETESSEVVKNFLLYQMGRDKKWGRGETSLGKKIINHIDHDLRQMAKTIPGGDATDEKRILIQIIRRYLGYGARYHKYIKDGNKL